MSQAKQPPVIHITPVQGWGIPWRDLWVYRELLLVLVWRDIKVRYKQTILGVGWAVLQPLLQTLVFTILFGKMAKMPSNGIPYPLFSFVGLMMWQFFAKGLNESALSLVSNQSLLTKVYFPRLILPLASISAAVVDWMVSCGLLLVFLWVFDAPLLSTIIYLPMWLIIAYLCCFACGIWLAALNAVYRDVAYVVPFLVQLGMFACPIIYPSTMVPVDWRWLYNLNPMASVIEGARAVVLGTELPALSDILIGLSVAIALAWGGLLYFSRAERTLADKI